MYSAWYIHLKCSICQRSGGVIVEGYDGNQKVVGCRECGLSSSFKLQDNLTVFEAGLEIEMGIYDVIGWESCC